MRKIRLGVGALLLAATCGAVVLFADTFAAITGSGVGGAFITGDIWTAAIAEQVRQNFNVLNTRLTANESAATSLDTRVDTLETGVLVFRTSVTLTDAQVKALPTTPITVLAAPGSGYRIKILGATLSASFAAGAYTNVNATSTLQLETGTGDWLVSPLVNDGALTDLNAVFSGNAHVYDLAIPAIFPHVATGWTQYVAGTFISSVNNSIVRIAMDNSGSGNLTGGNAANTLKVTVTSLKEPM